MSIPGLLFSVMPHFFYRQFFITPPSPETDCTGKTIIVTGANVGLGKEAARHYVRLNAEKVILACRSLEKGQAAVKDIEASTKRTGVLEVWELDLGSYESVKRFAERAKSIRRIDSLVENAGISTAEYKAIEGNESTSQFRRRITRDNQSLILPAVTVNVVSTFLLALLMLPKLQQVGKEFNIIPTLTIVSSEVHFFTPVRPRLFPSGAMIQADIFQVP